MGGVGRFMMSFFLFFSYFFLVKFSFFWYFFFGLTEGAVSRYLRFRIFFCRFFFGRRVFYRCSFVFFGLFFWFDFCFRFELDFDGPEYFFLLGANGQFLFF